MMTALARKQLSRTEQAGLLARAALSVAAERMGGRPPEPFLEGEDALQARIIKETRRRLKIAPDDVSDEALRAIEDELDAEMEAVAEPVDEEAALARASYLVTGIALVERRCIKAHPAPVLAVAVTPDGRRAISGSFDATLKVWDLEQGALLSTLEGHDKAVRALAVTPDGRRAVSGSDDETLKVWDLDQGALLSTLEGHGSGVSAVAVTPDGQRAVSGSDDRTLRLWDLQTYQELARFGADSALLCCATAPDGRTIVAGDVAIITATDVAGLVPVVAGHIHLLEIA
jgi:hypothetical protein